jgi:hypothetical protein
MTVKFVFRTGFMGLLMLNSWAWGLTVSDPAFHAEAYVSYGGTGIGAATFITSDHNGSLYTLHQTLGTVHRINPDKTEQLLASNLDVPVNAVWGGGTEFGDYLYVAEHSQVPNPGKILKIDASGNKSTFISVNYETDAIGIDHVGNYGGYMYYGTDVWDRYDRVTPLKDVSNFSSFHYDYAGCSSGIAFDPGTRYGGLMYVANHSYATPSLAGVWSLDASGNPTRFASSLVTAVHAEFAPVNSPFGGDLFVHGYLANDQIGNIFRISPDGEVSLFASGLWACGNSFTFGNDGAMYVIERTADWKNTIISRVIPEPGMLSLMVLGVYGMVQRRCRLGKSK